MRIVKRFFFLFFIFLPVLGFSQEIVNLSLSLKEKPLPFGLTKKIPADKPIISLALSGGGARALSHIGVIKALEELNVPIDYIIGTSMGSVIGGLYSAGYTINDLDSIIQSIKWEELFFLTGADRNSLFIDQKITEDKALVTLRLNGFTPVIPQSISTGNKISNMLTCLTLNAPINIFDSFDSLLFKYRAVSTELVKGKRIVLDHGSLSEAMRASSSASFLLPPIKKDSLILVDGGLVDNLPIKTAKEFDPDLIIASDATSSLRNKNELNYPWEIADQIVTIPSKIVWEENKKDADFLISLNLNNRKNNDFKNLDQLIKEGYNSAINTLTNVDSIIKNKFLEKLSIEKKYFKNLTSNSKPNQIEKKILSKYALRDSVSKEEILLDLYSFYDLGIYKEITASINIEKKSILNVNYELNPFIKTIKISGITLFPIDEAYKLFSNLYNRPYNSNLILKNIFALIKIYRTKGYMLATVEKISFDEDNGDFQIFINEGKVNKILIEGNKNTLDVIIQREFSSISGNYLSYKNLHEGLKNLTSTDLFDNVTVQYKKGEKSNKNLLLKLNEKLPNVLRFGLRVDNEYFSQFALDLRNENLFGDGSELGLSISGGPRNMSYVLEHKSNRIFNTYLTYKAQAFYKFNDVNQYSDDISEKISKFSRSRIGEYQQLFYGGFIGLGAHLRRLGTLTAEAKYEVNEIENVFDFPEDKLYKTNLFSLKLRLLIDSQNKYPYPTKGIYINTFYETAQKVLGGETSFAKFSFDYSGYFPINERHNLKPRFIFGFADETLPLTQQFNFGGQSNFLGYRDFEYRGRQVLISSLQYRYKLPINIYFDTYIKVRYDLGSSWDTQEQIHFKHLKHGLGLTVSLDTPIGPADFSMGRSLLLKETSPSKILSRGPIMFYFTIGYYY